MLDVGTGPIAESNKLWFIADGGYVCAIPKAKNIERNEAQWKERTRRPHSPQLDNLKSNRNISI